MTLLPTEIQRIPQAALPAQDFTITDEFDAVEHKGFMYVPGGLVDGHGLLHLLVRKDDAKRVRVVSRYDLTPKDRNDYYVSRGVDGYAGGIFRYRANDATGVHPVLNRDLAKVL